MKMSLHAVGRSQDILPFLALGAKIHEVEKASEADEAVKAAGKEAGALIILSEEFASAAEQAQGKLVFLSPGAQGSKKIAVERIREQVARSVGVDLIAKAGRKGRKDE